MVNSSSKSKMEHSPIRKTIWEIPAEKEELIAFVKQKGKVRQSRNQLRIISIKVKNLKNLQKALKEYGIPSTSLGP